MPGNRHEQPCPDDRSPLVVPAERLSATALDQLVEEFVTRSGTDYGETECPLERKKRDVHAQLASGEAVIVFDRETQTCDIVLRRDLRAEHRAQGANEPT